jgi:hypothetical protein
MRLIVYILMVADRHYDTEAIPFESKESAVAEAERRIVLTYSPPSEQDRKLNDLMIRDGWMFYCNCGEDGPCFWVVRSEVRP